MTVDTLIQYKLNVHTISPVHIGDNDTRDLSPYADFILSDDGEQVHYLNEQVVLAAVQAQGKLNQYLEGLRKGFDNNRSEFDLRSFLLGELGLDLDKITRQQVVNFGLEDSMRVPVSPTAKSLGRPYLPGSSLKGALRTAILYHWLTSPAGKRELTNAFRQLDRLGKELHRLRSLKREARHDRRARQQLRQREREAGRSIGGIFNEENLFGKITESDAQHIRLSDSPLLAGEVLGVYPAQRVRLRPIQGRGRRGSNADSDIPQFREGVRADVQIASGLTIRPAFRNADLNYLTGEASDWIHQLNRFAEDCIDNELYQLDQAETYGGRYAVRAGELRDFYEDLKDRLGHGRLLLRLGAGKTVYDNSLLLALIYGDARQKEEETYFRILRELLFGVHEDEGLFPMTRTLAGDGLPMGWVEIEVQTIK